MKRIFRDDRSLVLGDQSNLNPNPGKTKRLEIACGFRVDRGT